MKPEAQRIAIAEACGVKPFVYGWAAHHPTEDAMCFSADSKREVEEWLERLPAESWAKNYVAKPLTRLPDYLNDLNAMNEAEKTICRRGHNVGEDLFGRLVEICGCEIDAAFATAAQRAEAFLKTLGKWK